MTTDEIIQEIYRVLDIEAQSITQLKDRNDPAKLVRALEILEGCTGKVVLTGIGKSGHVARKLSSTLSSTGTPSIFLHPAESAHGDLGLLTKDDVVMVVSYGGQSDEIVNILRFCARKSIPVIVLTGKQNGALVDLATVALNVHVDKEACPLGLAPTSSTTASLALGDALAMALLRKKGFKEENFAEFHPAGALGKRLLTTVADLMHKEDALPLVRPTTPLRDMIKVMTRMDVRGVAGVVDEEGRLIGVVTDGDVRRSLDKSDNPLSETAESFMSRHPKVIDKKELAEKSLFVMEQFTIQMLFVVDSEVDPLKPVGLIHLQDLLKAGLR
jgi:arabinose-5-phosphate isomerase